MSKILKVVGASWLQTKISSYILGLLGLLAILALFIGLLDRIQDDGNYAATVFYSPKTGYSIDYWGQSNELANINRGVARAYIRRDVDTDGWSLLEVETDGSYPDEVQAYAAGIVEGALTWGLIHSHLENTIRPKCEEQPMKKQCDNLKDALEVSAKRWHAVSKERAADDPFWHHVHLHYTQIDGLYIGWKHGIERSQEEYDFDISELYWLNTITEIPEIQHNLNITVEDVAIDTLPALSSAFLRIVNETQGDGIVTKKLYVAQNAAGSYSSMTRILKRYKLNYHMTSTNEDPAPGIQVDFSGYPGSITSNDEFYLLRGKDHRMAVTGTPLRNYNNELWKSLNITRNVPIGPRISAANHLSPNVSSWGHVIARNNSGTACKQWLVVDFDTFDKIHDPVPEETEDRPVSEVTVVDGVKHTVLHSSSRHPSGLLWLVEQVPHLTHARDLTATFLDRGYMATYGLPYSPNISEITHTNVMLETYGEVFSVTESPRALAFQRGYQNATSLKAVVDLMRDTNATVLNRTSEGCEEQVQCIIGEKGYWAVIGARGDVVRTHREPYGIIDTKVVTGAVNVSAIDFIAIAGPPYTEEIKQLNKTQINKGNLATVYTDQFNDRPEINGMEIKNLIKKQQEQHDKEAFETLNKDAVKPFVWSKSGFDSDAHDGLPDKWAFGMYKPNWSW